MSEGQLFLPDARSSHRTALAVWFSAPSRDLNKQKFVTSVAVLCCDMGRGITLFAMNRKSRNFSLFVGRNQVLQFLGPRSPAISFASSGLREDVKNIEKLVQNLEKQISKADSIAIMDTSLDFNTNTLFISVGPEAKDRPARIYHCWKVSMTTSDMERTHGKACDSFGK